jgi:hypothetical protein
VVPSQEDGDAEDYQHHPNNADGPKVIRRRQPIPDEGRERQYDRKNDQLPWYGDTIHKVSQEQTAAGVRPQSSSA